MMILSNSFLPTSTTFFDNISQIITEIPFIKDGKKGYVSNVPSAFDIETSSFYVGDEKKCCMYAWGFGINGRSIKGRTWDEFLLTISYIISYYKINPKKRFIIYVHNLSYEFQFMRKYFEWEKVFSIDKRKPIYAITKSGIEFRCSYLLSGYSLDILGKNLTKYKVTKKVGDLDYSLIRHTTTPITDKEWGYLLNDIMVVMCHIQEEIERLGDITRIPITNTGYVRQLCREICFNDVYKYDYNFLMRALTLTSSQYTQMKRTYMGGFTHCNAHYVNKTLENVHSYDFTSSYPAVMVSEKFPMSKPKKYEPRDTEDFINCLKNLCCMFDCKFINIKSKCSYENYMSYSRCLESENVLLNNGRVVEADYILVSLTEQDFFIIDKLYQYDSIEISNFHIMHKAYLPKPLIETILDLYKKKTELKGIEEAIVEYLVSKGMVNSLYGMCVTDPCRDEIIYDGFWREDTVNIDIAIEKYNKNRNRFLYYAWGIWVTAYARRNLFSGIFEFEDDYIYSDTDSLKILNKNKHIDYINQYNENIVEKINDCLDYHNIPRELSAPKTKEGIVKQLGVWDYEGKYDRFKSLGAKRYMTEKDGVLSITIAGVNKEAGVNYLKYKYKTNDAIFENFTEDLYFPPHYYEDGIDKNGSGKLCHTYIDDEMHGEIIDYLGNKNEYHELSGIHMENTDYTLSFSRDFINYLLLIKEEHVK